MPEVRRCRPSERDAALRIVLAAFATDPLLRSVWPSDARYGACAPAFFGLLLDLRLEGGEVWVAMDSVATDSDLRADSHGRYDGAGRVTIGSVAMWDPPGGLYRQPPGQRWTTVQAAFTPAERAAWKAYDEAMGVAESAGPHWYLGVLATAPARQGSGLGRAVTAPLLAAADRAGLPAYLETASTSNVAIYQRLGFTVERDAQLPGAPRCWLMRRDPRPAGQPHRRPESRASEEAR